MESPPCAAIWRQADAIELFALWRRGSVRTATRVDGFRHKNSAALSRSGPRFFIVRLSNVASGVGVRARHVAVAQLALQVLDLTVGCGFAARDQILGPMEVRKGRSRAAWG